MNNIILAQADNILTIADKKDAPTVFNDFVIDKENMSTMMIEA